MSIKLDYLEAGYVGSNFRVTARDLTLASGQVSILRGTNGSGKSTFMKALAEIEGIQVYQKKLLSSPAAQFDYMGQSAVESVFENFTVEEAVYSIVSRWSLSELFEKVASLDSLLAEFPKDLVTRVTATEGQRLHDLSGGQRALVAIVSYLIRSKGRVLLLDEPAAGLDRQAVQSVGLFLREVAKSRPHPILIATHRNHFGDLLMGTDLKIVNGTVMVVEEANAESA